MFTFNKDVNYFQTGGITIGEGTIFAHDIQVMARNHLYDDVDLKSVPHDYR